jgi:hypothetical protein
VRSDQAVSKEAKKSPQPTLAGMKRLPVVVESCKGIAVLSPFSWPHATPLLIGHPMAPLHPCNAIIG